MFEVGQDVLVTVQEAGRGAQRGAGRSWDDEVDPVGRGTVDRPEPEAVLVDRAVAHHVPDEVVDDGPLFAAPATTAHVARAAGQVGVILVPEIRSQFVHPVTRWRHPKDGRHCDPRKFHGGFRSAQLVLRPAGVDAQIRVPHVLEPEDVLLAPIPVEEANPTAVPG